MSIEEKVREIIAASAERVRATANSLAEEIEREANQILERALKRVKPGKTQE